jgi:LPXTG-motif cell wall-anchored protein
MNMTKLAAFALLLIGTAGMAVAGEPASVPEIDPAMAIGALALLSGGLLVIRARRKK